MTGAKRLQHISGLGYRTYWLINFLYDMVGFGNGPYMNMEVEGLMPQGAGHS